MSSSPQSRHAIEIFYSYCHADEALRNELEKHLSQLRREGIIKGWHDRQIPAGKEWDGQINQHLDSADIILLLISSDFLASDYCNDIEVKRAMERHEAVEALVIPIILRSCDWNRAPFGKLQALPKDALPIKKWPDQDDAFLDVARGIRKAAEGLKPSIDKTVLPPSIPRPPAVGFVARRDAEGRDIVGRLKEELAPEKNQLVVLWGAGGVGKTTLAAEAAQALSKVFGRRMVWASPELRADFTFTTLLDEIATQLGRAELRELKTEVKEEQVRALLAEAQTLVVLDNFETIKTEEQAKCAKWLKQGAPCPALITTRQRVEGARNISINAMTMEEAKEFAERWIKGEAHSPRAFEGVELDSIIETADRNPRIMEWVLARIDLAGEPGEVLEELMQGGGDAAQRVFDGSFNLEQLGDDGRDALLALWLFVPDASRVALSEVAGFGSDGKKRLNDAVTRLSSLWLIETTGGNKRLKLEGLTRELAKNRLSKNSRADEFRQRFVAYLLRYAEAHAQPTPEDFDDLEAEKDNALSAMDVAFNMEDWESVQSIAGILANPVDGVLSVHGYWDEAIRRGEQGLKAARNSTNEGAIASFAHNAAVMNQFRGDLEEARRLYDESLEIKKKLGNQSGIATTLHELGRLAHSQGELAEARRLYDESLEIEKKLGNQSGIAITLHQLGWLAQDQGGMEEARRLYDESLEIKKKLGDQRGIASTLHNLAAIAQAQGELEEARQLYDESLEIEKKLGDQSAIASTLHQLATLAQTQGELEEARRLYDESLEINKKLGNQSVIAITLHSLGILAKSQGDLAEARRLYNESLETTKKLGDKSNIALIYYNLGLLEERENNREEAARLFRESLNIFEKLRSPNAEDARRGLERVESEDS